MSLLQQLFRLRGSAPMKLNTMGDLASALKDAEAARVLASNSVSETTPETAQSPTQGPCLEDPLLPALNLLPSAEADPVFNPVLGTPPPPVEAIPEPEFVNITPPLPRIAPFVPAPPVIAPGKSEIRLRLIADSTINQDELIRHVSSFPGVTACRVIPDNAHD